MPGNLCRAVRECNAQVALVGNLLATGIPAEPEALS